MKNIMNPLKQKIGWVKFWANFSQTHLVTLLPPFSEEPPAPAKYSNGYNCPPGIGLTS
jgi:hypothetical protein